MHDTCPVFLSRTYPVEASRFLSQATNKGISYCISPIPFRFMILCRSTADEYGTLTYAVMLDIQRGQLPHSHPFQASHSPRVGEYFADSQACASLSALALVARNNTGSSGGLGRASVAGEGTGGANGSARIAEFNLFALHFKLEIMSCQLDTWVAIKQKERR